MAKRPTATPIHSSERASNRKLRWVGIGVCIIAVGLAIAVRHWYSEITKSPASTHELLGWQSAITPVSQWDQGSVPAYSASPSDNGYVGIEACRQCHEAEYESYAKTAHQRSFYETDPVGEPESATFHHTASSRRYAVYRKKGKLHHRETILGSQGQRLAVTDFPIKYTVGSGAHAHTYLCEANGHLVESPVSWFRGAGWQMSPGYDSHNHPSFTRVANFRCVFCHVGMVERSSENHEQFRIVEQSIGCERCHGPGGEHVNRHAVQNAVFSDPTSAGSIDAIVHPGKLSRERSEAICQQCHLQGIVPVTASGKTMWDFRPGALLAENRSDFQFADNESFRVAGHVEQMHQSECYQGSSTLTCITCHDPHHEPPSGLAIEFYRNVCQKCHPSDSCGIDSARREHVNDNNCAACHMPKQQTNVTHAALHHHRIGIHESKTLPHEATSETILVPLLKSASISDIERKRRTLLAVHYAIQGDTPIARLAEQVRGSITEMYSLIQTGKNDSELVIALARTAVNLGDQNLASRLARRTLETAIRGSWQSNEALDILGELAFQQHDNAAALRHYQELTLVRYVANDFFLLGMCQRNAGEIDEATESLRRALAIQPNLVAAHQVLADILQSQGVAGYKEHLTVAAALTELEKQNDQNANKK